MTPKMSTTATAPEMMPVLSRGKHRNPRRGACFMEMASFLAGERWSDHPACTHPLLAHLARLVNDSVSDEGRTQLVPLIPAVIGLSSEDPRMDATIALRSALAALPISPSPRQHVLATGIIACERVLADLDGRERDSVTPQSQQVLDEVPDSLAWARSFSGGSRPSRRTFHSQTAPYIVSIAVEGIAVACAPDVEQRMIDLLVAVIADCQAQIRADETRESAALAALAEG